MAKDLLENSLYVLKNCGMHPKFRSFKNRLKHFCLLTILVAQTILLSLEVILNWEGTKTLENGVEVIFGNYQVIIKSVTLYVFRQELVETLDQLTFFWPKCKFGELETELTNIHILVKNGFTFFAMIIYITILATLIKPLFATEKLLPLKNYELCNINNNKCYISLFLWQVVSLFCLGITAIGFDGLFIYFLTDAFCQFRMIKYGFKMVITEDTSDNISLQRLAELVDHHVLQLDFVNRVNNIYSRSLLGQFSSTVIDICIAMYLTSLDGLPPSGIRLMTYVPMLFMLLLQIYIYCFAGEKIVEEAATIADVAYDCDWTNIPCLKLRQGICLVIQRAQVNIKISAGGLFDLNIATFSEILKKSSSFYMAMLQLRANENESVNY